MLLWMLLSVLTQKSMPFSRNMEFYLTNRKMSNDVTYAIKPYMPFAFAFHLHLILILSLAYVLKPFYCHNSKIPNTVNNDLDIRVLLNHIWWWSLCYPQNEFLLRKQLCPFFFRELNLNILLNHIWWWSTDLVGWSITFMTTDTAKHLGIESRNVKGIVSTFT